MRQLPVAILVTLFAATLSAQQPPAGPPQLLLIHEEIPKPSMIADYERLTKEFGAMVRSANVPFHYNVISTDDFHYYYVMPMKSFGDIDRVMQVFMADLPQKAGKEKLADFMRRSGATMEMTREWVVVQRDDLSYRPAKPRLTPAETTWFQYDFYYLKPGTEEMIDQIANDWKATMAAANLDNGFTLYQTVVGGELPALVVAIGGKSPADLAAQSARTFETLGDKGTALQAKTFGIVRRFETKYGRSRPDLSNPAPPAQVAK